jgi:hypothetical protein
MILVAVLLLGSPASAQERDEDDVTFLGFAREIPRSRSADRDAPAFNLGILPRDVRTAAGELALVRIPAGDLTIRTGFYGLLELESEGETESFGNLFPQATGAFLWRGAYGYYVATSFDAWARAICARCGLEAGLMYRHESEHITASNSGGPGPDYSDRPHVGDAFVLDAALRWAGGDLVLIGRLQHDFYLPDRSGYAQAPAVDLYARYEPWEFLAFFFAGYVEYAFGQEVEGRSYPDAYVARGRLGVALPSDLGDVELFMTGDVGHREGLAAFTEEATLALGARLALGPVSSED